jgi:hypothetical protein
MCRIVGLAEVHDQDNCWKNEIGFWRFFWYTTKPPEPNVAQISRSNGVAGRLDYPEIGE